MKEWVAFLERRPEAKQMFEYCVMEVMSEIMAHTITLHLLDAPGRAQRFLRKQPALADKIPQKELASYLNLSAETLSRLHIAGRSELRAGAAAVPGDKRRTVSGAASKRSNPAA
jgi:hypothetical protein